MFSRIRLSPRISLYCFFMDFRFLSPQIPENAEIYVVTLTSVTGGGSVNPTVSGPQINPLANSITVTIGPNDAAVKFERVTN